jgi:hypothetical protein
MLRACIHYTSSTSVPLQEAPQMAQVNVTFFLPALPSSRLPQSLQKMREPIADIVSGVCLWRVKW